MCNFVILFACLYGYGFLSDGKKIRGEKFCTHVGLLSGQVFFPFGELWLAGSHGGGGMTSGMNGSGGSCASEHGMGIRNCRRRR